MKTLIFTTRLCKRGGVSNFYRMLQPYFNTDFIIFEKHQSDYGLIKILFFIYDYIIILCSLIIGKYDCYVLNPSLVNRAVVRDTVFAATIKLFRKKLVVFFHGWDLNYQETIQGKFYFPFFRKTLCNADLTFVLSRDFKEKLIQWGNTNRIEVAFTCYDPLIVDESRRIDFSSCPIRIIYLSRVEEKKGIFIVLDAYRKLKEIKPAMFSLTVAGDGNSLDSAKKYVKDNGIPDIDFLGYIRGEEKKECLNSHHIFFFPSYYPEGLPCALLEAMACGLVIVTRNVGGVPGFFTDEMGFSTDSKDPEVFRKWILEITDQPEKMKEISLFNRQYALANFSSPKIAKAIANSINMIQPQ